MPVSRTTRSAIYLLLVIVVFAAAVPAGADEETTVFPEAPVSLGQPARYRIGLGLIAGYDYERDEPTSRIFANITPEGYFPHLGIDLLSLEGALGLSDDSFEAALGYYIRAPYLRAGVEYNVQDNRVLPVFVAQYALRRGGLFGRGSEIRIDYRPSEREFMFGININNPFRKYHRTRPVKKWANLPRGNLPDPSMYFERIRKNAEEYRAHIRMPGHTFDEEDAAYHRELINAFTMAVGGDAMLGDQLASAAESIIFDQIVVPYNRYFGRHKKPQRPAGYVEKSVAAFGQYLSSHLGDGESAQRETAREVFRRTVVQINRTAVASRNRWETAYALWVQKGRFVWMPLNYGLRPEQYDTQPEWDSVMEKLTEQEFSDANTVKYLVNEQFHPELKRMILDTETYHVLHIHDFQGRHADDTTDKKGWDMVAQGYMRAFINAIKALDRGERKQLPQFMIFIDQIFYQGNNSRNIITYLEDLYDPGRRAPVDEPIRSHVAEVHRELIETIQGSFSLNGLSEDTLRKLFKVHINVTNAWDPTFAFDVTMRDHRKIAFRDVFEDDPASGVGILTGTGVGEHYHPPGWEDRGLVIRGTALLELKRSSRRLCESQGFEEDEVPEYLKERPFPEDYGERCNELREKGWRASILVAMNDTGYGNKKATVLRAAMYNLARKGSILIAIDSLWLSDFWAGMFISAALRGAHVYPIAPSPENAPSSADFTLYLMQQNFELMLRAREFFEEELAKTGGTIRVGLYAHNVAVDAEAERLAAFLDGRRKHPFLKEDFPLHPAMLEQVRAYISEYDGTGDRGQSEAESNGETAEEMRPFLHMKTQFFATDVAMRIAALEEWVSTLRQYVEIRHQQLAGVDTLGLTPDALTRVGHAANKRNVVEAFRAYLDTLEPDTRDKAVYAFTIGSMNQDRRGMVSDGEVLAAVSGYFSLIAFLDMVFIVGTSSWPSDPEALEAIFPDPGISDRMRQLSRYFQNLF
jgi:hypothetical protein